MYVYTPGEKATEVPRGEVLVLGALRHCKGTITLVPMTRYTDVQRELELAAAFVRALKERGYWNYSGLRWRNDTTVLAHTDLAYLCLSWFPQAADMLPYLRSRRFRYNLAFYDLSGA